ncbi:MAG: phosphate-starvation-inducible PsiE family protein [Flavobacterium sp.]|uniref:phosphate-starvation-inducible PsiE family protein n=1 Tax=Flavobacterium sp. TaxID=239 RepID=UPI003BDF3E89
MIIIVGYELFKSLYIILQSNQMPVKSITKVAAIAMANKVITLNLKEIEPIELFGISTLIISIGVSYFLFQKDPEIKE